MIQSKSFVSGEIITITEASEIKAMKMIHSEDTNTWYREVGFRDKKGNHVTLQLHAENKEDIEVKDFEK